MKQFKTIAIVFMLVIATRVNGAFDLSKNNLVKKGTAAYQAVGNPFQAGYGYTQEEKDNAREEIALLKEQKEKILSEYNDILSRTNLSKQEKSEYCRPIESSIEVLNEEIRELQLITGDVWSDLRKRVWAGVTFAGAALVTYKFFGSSIIAIVAKYGKNPTKLVEDQKKSLKAQQEKQLPESKKLEKEKTKEAQEAEKVKIQKQQEEAKKIAEQIIKEQQENKRKAEQVELDRINQAVVDAQESVKKLQEKLADIDSACNGDGPVDQSIIDERDLIETNLSSASEQLARCIADKKSFNKLSIEAQKQEFFKAQQQEKVEIQSKMLKDAGKTLVQGAAAGANLLRQFVGFVAKEVEPRKDALLRQSEDLDGNYRF